jgi:hypothetical protein
MPSNNGKARKAQRKDAARTRLVDASRSDLGPRSREIARGFTSGKRLTPYLAARELASGALA